MERTFEFKSPTWSNWRCFRLPSDAKAVQLLKALSPMERIAPLPQSISRVWRTGANFLITNKIRTSNYLKT
ncbi:MAG: hypothetical protein LBF00_00005 [Mycoplasmataceae bacterium]|nr:hypothetical protein [Mycoplasmataceae bacterium]